ncbi:unnamed protein product [Nippostrongylus brasiliensis]|uniref:Uncharacterized protein n=1 Tax=Nippostrongylus brasiliensis TaxID=27835 RepID=A0A0N4XM70_NIPBR|nr:unnamed protein product [Nippostrongylus brasiliensis]
MGRGGAVRNRKPASTDSEPIAARMRIPNKVGYILPSGGTLVKLVYSTVCERIENSNEPEVLLNFKKFTSIEACLEFIKDVSFFRRFLLVVCG